MSRIFAEMDRDGNDDCVTPSGGVAHREGTWASRRTTRRRARRRRPAATRQAAKRDFDKARGWRRARRPSTVAGRRIRSKAAGRGRGQGPYGSSRGTHKYPSPGALRERALLHAAARRAARAGARGGGGGGRHAPRRGGAAPRAGADGAARQPQPRTDRNRSGEHCARPIFDVVDHREGGAAASDDRRRGRRCAEPAHREILNADVGPRRRRPHARRHESTACTTPTRRARAARSRRTTGWATTGRGWWTSATPRWAAARYPVPNSSSDAGPTRQRVALQLG